VTDAGHASRVLLGGALLVVLAGCSWSEAPRSEEEAGALAAAQAYVDAIAARDLDVVEAMTDPTAFEDASGPDRDVDVRAALVSATDAITDPWVSLAGPTYDSRHGTAEYVVETSYAVRDLTGGGRFVLTLQEDASPGDAEGWRVTRPLIVRAATYSELDTATLGGVELTYGSSRHEGVWGYPGGYLLEAPSGEDVEPVWVAVGAADATTWDVSLPMLGSELDD
jgi:hypothetical protein